jgi:hypothetical protein
VQLNDDLVLRKRSIDEETSETLEIKPSTYVIYQPIEHFFDQSFPFNQLFFAFNLFLDRLQVPVDDRRAADAFRIVFCKRKIRL